jgi:hypothetical protein
LNLVSDVFGFTMMLHLLLVLDSHDLTAWCRHKHSQHGERRDDMPVVPFANRVTMSTIRPSTYAKGPRN